MNIGTASDHSGLPPKTIRYYEEIGLIKADRAPNGYRDYSETHLHKLAFLHRARGLGFSIEECRQLLALYEDKSRASGDVKELAEQKLVEIDRKPQLTVFALDLGHAAGNQLADAGDVLLGQVRRV